MLIWAHYIMHIASKNAQNDSIQCRMHSTVYASNCWTLSGPNTNAYHFTALISDGLTFSVDVCAHSNRKRCQPTVCWLLVIFVFVRLSIRWFGVIIAARQHNYHCNMNVFFCCWFYSFHLRLHLFLRKKSFLLVWSCFFFDSMSSRWGALKAFMSWPK